MKLSIGVKEYGGGVVELELAGTIDSDSCVLLDREIAGAVSRGVSSLVLDMAGVEFMTSSGVGTITKAKVSLKRVGAGLAITNMQPQIRKVFEIIRLLPTMNVFESRAELDEYLGKVQARMIEG